MNVDSSNGLRERLARLPKVAVDDAPPASIDPEAAASEVTGLPGTARPPVSTPSVATATAPTSAPSDMRAHEPAQSPVPNSQHRPTRRKRQQRRRNIVVTAAYILIVLICLTISLDLFAPLDPRRELVAAPDEQGDLYSGSQHLLDGSFSGQVTISYLKGDSYIGELRGNRFSGYGQFTATEGWSIEGDFVDGRLTGKGVYRDHKGVYEGSFENSLPHGQGSYHAASGWTYDGQFQAGKVTGYGLFTAADGSEYEGSFLNGYAHGRGKVQSPAWSYDGDFTAGYRNGQGTLTFADGQTVTAQWDAGQPVP